MYDHWRQWPPFGGAVFTKPRRARSQRVGEIAWHKWPPFGGYPPRLRRSSTHPAERVGSAPPVGGQNAHAPIPPDESTPATGLLNALLAGTVRPRDVSPGMQREIARWGKERTRALAGGIQRLVDRGHRNNAKRARRDYLASSEVMMHALLLAARRRWPVRISMTPDEVTRIRLKRFTASIEQCRIAAQLTKPARAKLRLVGKRDGGYRPICNFYWVDYARQIALKSALTPFANLHEGQFMFAHEPCRRGPAAVRRSLLTALEGAPNDSSFVQFDVTDFYGSISHDWLEAKLGLDPAIIRKHVHTGGMMIEPIRKRANVRGQHEASKSQSGRWGIPQGSALSSLIAEWVMADVLRSAAVFGELAPLVWSDNVGVLVPRGRVEEIESLVRLAFSRHGAGPFALTVKATPIEKEFRFLGTWYVKRRDAPVAYIPDQVAAAWEASIAGRIMVASLAELAEIERHATSKLAAWSWWPGATELGTAIHSALSAARAERVMTLRIEAG